MRAFLQGDQGDDVGKVILKGRIVGHVVDHEGIDRSPAGCSNPPGFPGQALGAQEGGRPAQMVALAALLNPDGMLPAAFLEALRIRADDR